MKNKFTKKLVAMILAMTMIFALSANAFAMGSVPTITEPSQHAFSETLTTLEIYTVDGGHFFRGVYQYSGAPWAAYIYFNDAEQEIEFITKNLLTEDNLYTMYIDYDELSAVPSGYATNDIHEDTVAYCFENIAQATITPLDYSSTEEVASPRDSNIADLQAQLRNKHGSPFSPSLLYSSNMYDGQQRLHAVRVYEEMQFRCAKRNVSRAFGVGSSIAGIVAWIPGVNVSAALVSTALGVASAYIDYNAKVECYYAIADYAKKTTIDGSQYNYAAANKLISYEAISEINTAKRAQIVSSAEYIYSPSSSFYNSNSSLANEGMRQYNIVGARP